MADQAAQPLDERERAELEQLRAEKAAREQAARERAELEELRASQLDASRDSAAASPATDRASHIEERRIRAARERGARLMEPDADLRMPLGQKIVLGVLALLVALVIGIGCLVG